MIFSYNIFDQPSSLVTLGNFIFVYLFAVYSISTIVQNTLTLKLSPFFSLAICIFCLP